MIVTNELNSYFNVLRIVFVLQVMICDESHSIRNKNTRTSNVTVDLIKSSIRCILLSGTPALNKPVEVTFYDTNLQNDKKYLVDYHLMPWSFDISGLLAMSQFMHEYSIGIQYRCLIFC